ncbi:unnamed protein product [Nyctereutes procyonoides]|uniref:Translationally-controlled tumor protein n=1 Tax=Nyctereutes procyonoides TaxID=34880 RepID=A0A811Z7W4_NYCPR|nr:unnamed protein product [Nyctereutes procyonoides]
MFSNIYKIWEISDPAPGGRPEDGHFTKAYKKYINDCMNLIKGRLEEQRPKIEKPFMTGAAEQIKHFLANSRNYQFLFAKNMNLDGVIALLDYNEDNIFKDVLEMEKC